ncbi:MAG: RNA-binding S4 domain-containing protein [Betaproteobacteria bacterium]|nr:RNA-binding S4 domain-containing protein [Betaproteobacteria bacterium]
MPGVRLDKWLWAARLFKTRQLAIEAIEMGRVEVAGERVKPAKTVHVGDALLVRRPPYEMHLIVRAVAEQRVAAPIARTYYDETPASRQARERLAAELSALPPPVFSGRPTKRDRRAIEKWHRHADAPDDADT